MNIIKPEDIVFIDPNKALSTLSTESIIHILENISWHIASNEFSHFREMCDFISSLSINDEIKDAISSMIKKIYTDFVDYGYGYGYGYGFLFDNIGIGTDLI
jgi:hypothetical protein